jgi:hypothetical protein
MECRLCPRVCKLNEGQRGFCFVGKRADFKMLDKPRTPPAALTRAW